MCIFTNHELIEVPLAYSPIVFYTGLKTLTNNDLNLDFKNYSCQVLSPELPCGSAWLANCLFELNISVVNKWDLTIDDEWIRTAPYRYIYNDKESWQQVLPSLQYQKEFTFHTKHAISFQHLWPLMANKNCKTMFFVRHPFDALFSFWRRNTYNSSKFNGTFDTMMNQKYHHYAFSVKDYLLIYYSILRSFYTANDCLIISFENYKSHAFETLSKALDYLGINKSKDEITEATMKSDVSLLLNIEKSLKSQEKLNFKNHFKGQAYEFNDSYSQCMINSLNGTFDNLCQWFDYPYPASTNEIEISTSLSDEQLQVIATSICKYNPNLKESILQVLIPIRNQISWKNK